MEPTTIWLITSGCYSDYGVHCAFKREDDAKVAVATLNADPEQWSTARVERLDLWPAGYRTERAPRFIGSVELWDSGEVGKTRIRDASELTVHSFYERAPDRPRLRYVRAPCHGNKGGRLEVTGKSHDIVAQVLSDRIRMFKAGAWNPKPITERVWHEGDDEGGAS